jgi:phosphatidylglycerol:prolipoprotein diacylglycerol transferase
LYPILFEIPNRSALPAEIVAVEVVLGIACLLAWMALRTRAPKGWAATLLSTGAILVALHFLLSWFMGSGPITIYSFGVVIILGFLAGVRFLTAQTDRLGLPTQKVFDWGFWLLLTGIVGARVLYALLNYDEFEGKALEIFAIWKGGLVWYGGLIPTVFVGIWLLRRYELPVLSCCDAAAVALMLGLGIGRWACLLAGDDYGKPTDLWFGIRFYNERSLVVLGAPELRGVALHPTQLYMSVNALWLFFGLEWIRRRAKYAGQAFAALLILYSVTRALLIEPFRGDFVERNPGYGKHAAARLAVEREGDGPAIVLPRGAAVSGDGREGRLLGEIRLGAGEKSAMGWAMSNAPVKKTEMAALHAGLMPWKIDRVEGLEGATARTVRTRLYRSDLPSPPGYVSISQWISVGVVVAGVAIWLLARRLQKPGFSDAVAARS